MVSNITNRTLLALALTFPVQAIPLQAESEDRKVQPVWCEKSKCTTSSGVVHYLRKVDGLHHVELPVAAY